MANIKNELYEEDFKSMIQSSFQFGSSFWKSMERKKRERKREVLCERGIEFAVITLEKASEKRKL